MNSNTLGFLEQQVMDVVWQKKKCTVRELLIVLTAHKKIAYTTVATIVKRLHTKGLLSRREGELSYVYSPRISKESYVFQIAESFINSLVSNFGAIALTSFVDSIDKLPKTRKKHLIKVLEHHDEKK